MSDEQWAEITVPKGEEPEKVEYEIEDQEEKTEVEQEDTTESSWKNEDRQGWRGSYDEEETEEEEISNEPE